MLTDTGLRKLRPLDKSFKVADRDGMYVTVSTTGTKSFRYDYRLNGRRETLTIGKYDDTAGAKHPREPEALEFGMTVSLAEARTLLSVARRLVERGESPSRSKAERRQDAADALTFAPAVKWLMQGDLVAIAFASVKHHRTKHWALAVGVEGLVVGQSHFPQRILLLDSGGAEPCFHAHNARLRLPDAGPGSRRAKPGWHKEPKQKMIIWMHESESWQPEAVRLLAAIRVRRTS